MKHFIVSAAIGALFLLPACDTGGDGTLDSCVTAMVGSFTGISDGAPSGSAIAQLQPSGTLVLQFTFKDEATGEQQLVNGEATIDQSGAITDASGQVRLQGNFDLDNCSGSGDWSAGSFTGTWELQPP